MAGGTGAKDGADKPLAWTRWIAHRPLLFFGLGLTLHMSFVVISAVLFATGNDILPLVFDTLPLALNDETMNRRLSAWDMRNSDIDADNSPRQKRDLRPSFSGVEVSLSVNLRDPPTGVEAYQRMTDLLIGAEISPNEDDLYGAFGKHKAVQFMGGIDRCCSPSSSLMPFSKRYCHCNPHSSSTEEPQDLEIDAQPSYGNRHKRATADNKEAEALDEFEAYRQRKNRVYEREDVLSSITIIYEDAGGDIFTKENLRKIAKFEFEIYNMPAFQQKWCRTTAISSMRSCQQFMSVLRLYDGSYSYVHDDLFDPSFTKVTQVALKAYNLTETEDIVKFLIASDSEVNMTRGVLKSRMTRSQIYFGYPLNGFNKSTDLIRQRNELNDWMFGDMIPYFKKLHNVGIDNLHFYFYGSSFYWAEALRTIFTDWMYLVGSILFIFFFMWLQTGSLFITSFGLISILTSFLGANIIYRYVVGYKIFGIFNVLAIFIILGIGADDIFIYSDTWRYHLRQDVLSLEMRLSSTFKRAALAMFVTSLTTMVAFFVNSFSPLLSVSAFGSFAGITVAVNYISVITYFPAVVTVYHKYFENKACCCCGKTEDTFNDTSSRVSDLAIAESHSTASKQPTSSCSDRLNLRLSSFFGGPFFRFVTHKVVRVCILVVFVGLLSGAVYLATTIKLAEESFVLFGSNNVYELAKGKNLQFMSNPNERLVSIRLVWGLDLQDKSMCPKLEYNRLDPCEGKTVWVDDFDLSSEESQLGLLNFCRSIRHLNPPKSKQLMIAINSKTGENNMSCFIEDMAEFYAEEASQSWYPPGLNLSLPLTHAKVSQILQYNPSIYANDSMLYLHRHFETAMMFWLTHRYTNETIPDKRSKFKSILGWKEVGVRNLAAPKEKGFFKKKRDLYEVQLRYASAEIKTEISPARTGLNEAIRLMDVWEDFMFNQTEKLPRPISKAFQISGLWTWMKVLENLSTQSISACAVGLLLALIVIFLGTTNILTALWSTFLLVAVTICVIAVIPIMGWTFGLMEALNLCLVVGMAADYIVHFSEAYHMSAHSDRMARLQDTLGHVGVSILSGAITTLGASFFMMFAEIMLFQQFGVFVFCTIGFSVIFTLFVFIAAFSLFGPQGYTGSFLTCCKGRRKYQEQTADAGSVPVTNGKIEETGLDNEAYEEDSSKM